MQPLVSGRSPTKRTRVVFGAALLMATVSTLLSCALIESGLLLSLAYYSSVSAFLPSPIRSCVEELYRSERHLIQFSPDCAQYDPRLGYRLRPGRCRFANREFATTYMINSRGLRDDETSLHEPTVIVLGDSYAMGWGVEQDETYPQVIERNLGVKVLNAAISS